MRRRGTEGQLSGVIGEQQCTRHLQIDAGAKFSPPRLRAGRLTEPGDIMPAETVMRSIHHGQNMEKRGAEKEHFYRDLFLKNQMCKRKELFNALLVFRRAHVCLLECFLHDEEVSFQRFRTVPLSLIIKYTRRSVHV